jgi:ubiquitin-protein ligase
MTDTAGSMRRLTKELMDMPRNESKYWTLKPVDDSLRSWAGEIHNLDHKRHRCRKYRLTIDIPERYPFKPPRVKFIDRIRCENVRPDGTIRINCVWEGNTLIDILGNEWSPGITIAKLMNAIVCVLTEKPVTGLFGYSNVVVSGPSRSEVMRLEMRLRDWTDRAYYVKRAREVVNDTSTEYRNTMVRT